MRGEAEKTVEELFPQIVGGKYDEIYKSKGISYKKYGKIFSNPDQEVVYDLDSLPFPLRRDMNPKNYLIPELYLKNKGGPIEKAMKRIRSYVGEKVPYLKEEGVYNIPIMSSRGCSHGKCKFCYGMNFPGGNIYRVRSNESIIRELKEVDDEYGLGIVEDHSACFLGGKSEQMGSFLDSFSQNFEDAYLAFMIRSDSLLKAKGAIEKHLKKIDTMSIGVESFSDAFLKRNMKGVTSKTNREAVTFLESLREKRGDTGIRHPLFYLPMTIDCDSQTTLREFKEHYNRMKSLRILSLWEPNIMTYFPLKSWAQQDEIWEKDALSKGNLENYFLRDILKNVQVREEYWLASTKFEEDKLKEREEKLRKIFDPLVGICH